MCYWAYSVILGFGGESTLSGITDEFTESWRRAQTSTPEEEEGGAQWRNRGRGRAYRGRASLVDNKGSAGSIPRSRSAVPRSRYYSKARGVLQEINRGRGRGGPRSRPCS